MGLVACRSCSHWQENVGRPKLRRRGDRHRQRLAQARGYQERQGVARTNERFDWWSCSRAAETSDSTLGIADGRCLGFGEGLGWLLTRRRLPEYARGSKSSSCRWVEESSFVALDCAILCSTEQ